MAKAGMEPKSAVVVADALTTRLTRGCQPEGVEVAAVGRGGGGRVTTGAPMFKSLV